VHRHLERTIALLDDLVAIDTTFTRSNLRLIDYAQSHLRRLGIDSTLIPSPDGDKANLHAVIGPAAPGGVVLSGHTDVVPVDGQPWSADPFVLRRTEDKLFGRGACDMKGFIAAALAFAEDFAAAGLKRPAHLAFSYDEECGCLGAPALIDQILAEPAARPRLVIVGEPTGLKPLNAHKGCSRYRTLIRGKAAHSSMPDAGCNAIGYAGRLLSFMDRWVAEELSTPPDPAYDPPRDTLNYGLISGGTSTNIVAQDCMLEWEHRFLPRSNGTRARAAVDAYIEGELLPQMRRSFDGARIDTETTFVAPAFAPEPGGPAETLAMRLSGCNESGAASFGTEAGLFQTAGLSTIILGPGDIRQAHQPDEFVAIEQIDGCLRIFDRLLADLAADA
jgi:acetylornithine deacetylase